MTRADLAQFACNKTVARISTLTVLCRPLAATGRARLGVGRAAVSLEHILAEADVHSLGIGDMAHDGRRHGYVMGPLGSDVGRFRQLLKREASMQPFCMT